jgi:hypothetical protein
MATWAGDAVLIDHHGNEHPVAAVLRSRPRHADVGLRSWSGTLSGVAPWPVMEIAGGTLTLRLPDGREGALQLHNVDPFNKTPVKVSGTGPPPFD